MPVEPITLLLRPRNFFANNPVMDVPPSYACMPSQIAARGAGVRVLDAADRVSELAFGGDGEGNGCCGDGATAGGTREHGKRSAWSQRAP